VFKPRVENHVPGRFARWARLLVVGALLFGPMSACYAHVRPAGAYYGDYYTGGGYRGPDRYYYPRERYRYYRAPDTYYRGGYSRDYGRRYHDDRYREHRHRHLHW
jgi:hypothetical protein